jgi:DNA-binding NarL/FixJ family response regulator
VIRFVAEGGTYIPAEGAARGRVAPARPRAPRAQPTGRQLEVLKRRAKGLSNKQIARDLDISEGTVKQHMHDVCAMLRRSSRARGARRATRLGVRPRLRRC